MNNGSMTQRCKYLHLLDKIPMNVIYPLYRTSILTTWRIFHIIISRGCTVLPYHEQCSFFQIFTNIFPLFSWYEVYFIVILICLCIMISDVSIISPWVSSFSSPRRSVYFNIVSILIGLTFWVFQFLFCFAELYKFSVFLWVSLLSNIYHAKILQLPDCLFCVCVVMPFATWTFLNFT